MYITRKYGKDGNAVTVLDAKTGDYVESINPRAQVMDMAVFGSHLALATNDGLKFIALK